MFTVTCSMPGTIRLSVDLCCLNARTHLNYVTATNTSSVLWYCWLGLLTCKNRLPYNLYCVGGDVKHCSFNQLQQISSDLRRLQWKVLLLCDCWMCQMHCRISQVEDIDEIGTSFAVETNRRDEDADMWSFIAMNIITVICLRPIRVTHGLVSMDHL